MDLQTAFDQGFDVLKAYVDRSFDAYADRIASLEKRISEMPAPKDGKDADEDAIVARVAEKMTGELAGLRETIEAIEPAPELPDIAGMIKEAIGALPEPDPLPDVGGMVKSAVDSAIEAIPVPQHGKDADPEEIRVAVADEVKRAVGELPAPKDGKSVTVEDVRPMIDDAVSKSVAGIATIKDGFIDREGSLVFTMSDGSTKNFGKVVGRDGADADMPALEKLISEKVAAIPVPKDGEDGVGFDDMTCEVRDDGVYLVWEKGEIVKEARLPVPIDRGVYKSGETYRPGNCVTWGGSAWICQKETTDKPGEGEGWRLAVKKGRDGKDKA